MGKNFGKLGMTLTQGRFEGPNLLFGNFLRTWVFEGHAQIRRVKDHKTKFLKFPHPSNLKRKLKCIPSGNTIYSWAGYFDKVS